MVSSTSTQQSKPTTDPVAKWAEAIVRRTQDNLAHIYQSPENHNVLGDVHRGDMILVRIDLKQGDWVLCRAGHVVGWLNIHEVKLIRMTAQPTKETIYVEPRPVQPLSNDIDKKRKTSIIQKLIGFFK